MYCRVTDAGASDGSPGAFYGTPSLAVRSVSARAPAKATETYPAFLIATPAIRNGYNSPNRLIPLPTPTALPDQALIGAAAIRNPAKPHRINHFQISNRRLLPGIERCRPSKRLIATPAIRNRRNSLKSKGLSNSNRHIPPPFHPIPQPPILIANSAIRKSTKVHRINHIQNSNRKFSAPSSAPRAPQSRGSLFLPETADARGAYARMRASTSKWPAKLP